MDSETFDCTRCAFVKKRCRVEEGRGPVWCPMIASGDVLASALERYDDPALREFARIASIQEGACYANRDARPFVLVPAKTRLEELIEFCGRMGYRKIGIAFCGGLVREAAALSEILRKHDLEVVAVACKVGGVPKERIGVKDGEKVRTGAFETMCNPVAQALVLNGAGTDFNVMLGLCIGHDSLFLKHVKGLTTVLAVKDRVTGHNPIAAIYTSSSYYQRLMKFESKE